MSVVEKVVAGGGRLLALSFLQRGGTFIMNMLTLRHLPTHIAGVGFSLELVLSTTFILREGLRLAALRETGIVSSKKQDQIPLNLRQLINTSWLCTALGLLCTLAASFFMGKRLYSSEENDFSTFQLSLWLYCLSAAIEYLTEPLYILAHSSLLFHIRVRAQGWGFFAKAIVQVIAVLYFHQGILAFGISQVAYAIVHGLIYLNYFVTQLHDPSFPVSNLAAFGPSYTSGFSWSLLHFWKTLTYQSILKYFLTEGDRLILSAFETSQQQGEYSIAFNIGSLAPRLVFLPIEDASKAMFSKLLGSKGNVSKANKEEAARMFHLALQVMSLCGLIFIFFATNYTRTLLYLLAGYSKTLDQIPHVLSWYCVSVYFLALNGICEAFLYAVGNETDLKRFNKFLILFFGITTISALILMHFLHLGSIGIILANCINMSCRIIYSLIYIQSYFESTATWFQLYLNSLPHRYVLQWMVCSWCIGSLSEVYFRGSNLIFHGIHVLLGLFLFAIAGGLLYRYDRRFFTDLAHLIVLK